MWFPFCSYFKKMCWYYHLCSVHLRPNDLRMWVGFQILCDVEEWEYSLNFFFSASSASVMGSKISIIFRWGYPSSRSGKHGKLETGTQAFGWLTTLGWLTRMIKDNTFSSRESVLVILPQYRCVPLDSMRSPLEIESSLTSSMIAHKLSTFKPFHSIDETSELTLELVKILP